MLNSMFRIEVSSTSRFPEVGRYANVTTGPVADLLDKFIFGLDENERGLDREQAVSLPSKFNSINDARLSYLKICQKLLQLLTSSSTLAYVYSVYNRESFERVFALQWNDDDDAPAPQPGAPPAQGRPHLPANPPPVDFSGIQVPSASTSAASGSTQVPSTPGPDLRSKGKQV